MLNTLTEYAGSGYFFQITEEEEGYVGTIYELKDGKLVEMACTRLFPTFLQASVSARRIIHSLLMDFFIDTVDTMRNREEVRQMTGYPADYNAQQPTRTEIAQDYGLWQEYVDPHRHTTEEEFNAMSIEKKVKFQREMWPHDLED